MTARGSLTVIGMTGEGLPIIKSTGCCPHFERQKSTLACTQECWYCKNADFREDTALQKHFGICRREQSKRKTKHSDSDLDAVVGGVAVESEQIAYQCQCGAVFYCPISECPICHSKETKITRGNPSSQI